MDFTKITLRGWQQFESIDIDFHHQLTVLTGANGSGKTTILQQLAKHFGWDVPSLSTPFLDKIGSLWKWVSGTIIKDANSAHIKIGEINYSNGNVAQLNVPPQNSAQYNIQINNIQSVKCFYIPSHRSVFRYQQLDNIPTRNTIDKNLAFQKVSGSTRNRYLGGHDQSSSFFMKETLISWSIFGRGNVDLQPDQKLLDYYQGFENTLKDILPKELGFQKFTIQNFEVVLECKAGNFIIDAASGGISAIIDMAWQIYMFSPEKGENFTVIIDEIENHLHPTMQRRILPDFIKAFPNVRFIVSTHSPLIVGSVKDSSVYVLKNNEQNRIISQKLDLINKAKTASEILDEVLGVSFTMPVWVEEELRKSIDKYTQSEITEASFAALRGDLAKVGLERLMPEAISRIIEKKDDQD
ncbi:MAG: AAA family ATPase [Candidatus Rhabdochlamydia sp.]